MGLEQNFSLMTAEQKRALDNQGKIELTTMKNSEEFKSVLSQLQNDFQYKLEVRMTDLVNRLLTEQEERARSMDDMRYQMEMKDKMTQEKSKHEREELRDRYM